MAETPKNEVGIEKLSVIDNQDDRCEIWYALSLLTVQERIAFLHYALRELNTGIMLKHNPPWVLFEVTNTTGETNEVYMDLMAAFAQFGIPKEATLNSLSEFLSERTKFSRDSEMRVRTLDISKLRQ